MAKDVMCTVENCKFWSSGDNCQADEITVKVEGGGNSANFNGETNCNTFAAQNK